MSVRDPAARFSDVPAAAPGKDSWNGSTLKGDRIALEVFEDRADAAVPSEAKMSETQGIRMVHAVTRVSWKQRRTYMAAPHFLI